VHFGVGKKLAEALTANGLVRTTSPFSDRLSLRGVTLLEPRLTAEVSYAEILEGGKLRADHVNLCWACAVMASPVPSVQEGAAISSNDHAL
jgi:hypothetical protein